MSDVRSFRSELLRITLPRTSVNKGIMEGPLSGAATVEVRQMRALGELHDLEEL
jgi:hypothetical protein